MSEHFDAYYEWLGIPPKDQPPNHYRLLGVELFESHPRAIENAADRQMSHVRSFQSGRHAQKSQEVLNRIAAARVCLLNPERKAAYDERLRNQMNAASSTVVSDDPPALAFPPISTSPRKPAKSKGEVDEDEYEDEDELDDEDEAESVWKSPLFLGTTAVLILLVAGGLTAVVMYSVGKPKPATIASPNAPPKKPPEEPKTPPLSETPATAKSTESEGGKKRKPKPVDTPPPSVAPSALVAREPTKDAMRRPGPDETFAIRLTGQEFVDITDSLELANLAAKKASTFTAEAWVRPNFEGGKKSLILFGNWTGIHPTLIPGRAIGWYLAVDDLGPVDATRSVRCRLAIAEQLGVQEFHGDTRLAVGGWLHVAVVRTAKKRNSQFTLFANGEQLEQQLFDGTWPNAIENLFLGAPGRVARDAAFSGEFHSFRLSNRERYDGSYTPPLLTSDKPTSVLLTFSEGRGPSALDMSAQHHTGEIMGGEWVVVPAPVAAAASPAPSPTATREPSPTPSPVADQPLAIVPTWRRTKVTVPAAELRTKVRPQVQDSFATQIANAKSLAAKTTLVQDLLSRARQEQDDAFRFVALQLAYEQAVAAGLPAAAIAAVEELERRFEVDGERLRTDAIKKAAVGANDETLRELVRLALEMAELSNEAGHHTPAEERFTLALDYAKRLKDAALQRSVRLASRRNLDALSAGRLAEASRKTLETSPDDPKANLHAGCHECFVEHHWETGLARLAKSGDATLAEAARRDGRKPTDPAEQFAVGEAWQSWAKQADERFRSAGLSRAEYWFRTALPGLKDAARDKCRERLRELAAYAPGQTEPVEGFSFPWLTAGTLAGEVKKLDGHKGAVTGLAVSRDGRRLASCGKDRVIRMWDLLSLSSLWESPALTVEPRALAFSPEGKFLVSNLDESQLGVWLVETGALHAKIVSRSALKAAGVDGWRWAFLSDTGSPAVTIWNLPGDALVRQFGSATQATALAVSRDGRQAAIGDSRGDLALYDIATGTELLRLQKKYHQITELASSWDDARLAVGTLRGLEVVSIDSGQSVASLAEAASESLSFSPDRRRLASANPKNGFRLWDLEKRQVIQPSRTDRVTFANVSRVAYLCDPRAIVLADNEGAIRLWRLAD